MVGPGSSIGAEVTEVTEETLIFEGGSERPQLRAAWEALAVYLDKQIESRKPVGIPHFGRFTFILKNGVMN